MVIVSVHTINSFNQLLQLAHFRLNSGLSKSVIVLDAVQQLGQAPKGIRFNVIAIAFRQLAHIVIVQILACKNK